MEKQNGPQVGTELEAATDVCTAVHRSGTEITTCYVGKKSDEDAIITYAKGCGKWIQDYANHYGHVPHAQGAESVVYLHPDGRQVIKINNGQQHAHWLEFFQRIIVHNLYFPNTAYTIEGYTLRDDCLAVILHQPLITIDRPATPEQIKEDLETNYGFEFKTINDVLDQENNIAIRDLHSENAVYDEYGDIVYIDPLIQFTSSSTIPKYIPPTYPGGRF